MSFSVKPLAIALCVGGLITIPVSAISASVESQIANLEKEVKSLKRQVAQSNMDHSNNVRVQHTGSKLHKKHHSHLTGQAAQVTPASSVDSPIHLTREELIRVIGSEGDDYMPFDLSVPGQAFVSTGPYVGVPIQFAGANLIVNSPSVNTDAQVLGIRKNITQQLESHGINPEKRGTTSHLLLSGVLEAQAGYLNSGGGPSSSSIDLTNVAIDGIFLGPSDWTLGFFELMYDNSSPIDSQFTSASNYTSSNSRVFVNKAFITIGNFLESPWYGSAGQFFAPFGSYSSVTVSNTLTKILGRTKVRALLVGMQQQDPDNAWYGSAYIFRGDSHVTGRSRIHNGGLNLGYKFVQGCVRGNVGGGVIANIADSAGMQIGAGFQNNEQLVHRVPAYDLRATLNIGQQVDLIGEFISATKEFNPNDLGYNGSGAKPWAFDLQASYSFKILDDKPSAIGVAYGQSNEALGLGIPLSRTSLVFNTSFWRNTLQSIELRHDKSYAASSTAMGAGVPSAGESGKSDNAVTAQFDYYF